MPCKFHGSSLVDVDVCSLAAEHALIGPQHAVDDGSIRLGAAGEEVNLGILCPACCPYQLAGMLAVDVVAVALRAFVVGLEKMAQYSFVSPVIVVAFEVYHCCLNYFCKGRAKMQHGQI